MLTFSKKQGASTITQQLARNMYNTIGFKKTIHRNNLESLLDNQIEIFLSDGLKFIPEEKEFEIAKIGHSLSSSGSWFL